MATPIFVCGAECGMVGTGSAAGGTKHWDSATGTVANDTSTFRSPGTRSFRFDSSGVRSSMDKTLPGTPVEGVARVYIRFGSLPNIDTNLCGFVNGTVLMGVGFDVETSALVGVAGATTAGSFPVTTGVWYRLDIKVDGIDGATHTTDWSVDGAAQTQASRATSASTLSTWRMGTATATTAVTATVYFDDLILSVTAADYPLGAGQCVPIVPTADGTHSFNAAGDFKYNNSTNVPTNATDTFGYVDDPINNISDFIAAAANAGGEYLEWTCGVLPGDVNTINAMEVVSGHHAAGTNANTQSLRLIDGASTDNILSDADMSTTALNMNTKILAAAPSGGAWTVAKVNAIKFRWSSSFTTPDITPVPYIDAVRAEVDYIAVAATPWLLTGGGTACFTVDHQILFNVIPPDVDPPDLGGAPQSAFVRQMGAGLRTNHVHLFGRGETSDR